MSLTELEARKLVEKYISEQDLRGFKYDFVKVTSSDKNPNEFGVIFNVFSPEDSLIDGPAVFIVDKNTSMVYVL
ncbi:hypothetical protein MNBD_GAMMA16-2094 [hydrothermal vent metagenome]|uniref:Uncharacterized protein n=1 Tax=hydrothermal vent metagenome TaxID=652676 RepID=A0A3B0ZPS1_9ZZZZ